LGDGATRQLLGLYVRFGDCVDLDANRAVHRLDASLGTNLLPGVTDLVPAYASLYVEFDVSNVTRDAVAAWIASTMTDPASRVERSPRDVELPVVYDGDDLPHVATETNTSVPEVVARHSGRSYHVHAVGFTPGFAYLAEVDEAIRVPRRETPRTDVPEGTVAMADGQTGVYGVTSPSGWNLLGRSLVPVYDPSRAEPFLLSPGDRVRFVATTGTRPKVGAALELLPVTPRTPVVRVVRAGLLDLVVDRGRVFSGRYGLARSGPLDSHSASLAQCLVRAAPDDALLEISRIGGRYEILSDAVLAFTGYGLQASLDDEPIPACSSFPARRGQHLDILPTRNGRGCRGYLAVAGGIEATTFRGSTSPDLRGRIGRALQPGDVLGRAREATAIPGRHFQPYRWQGRTVTLGILNGPQYTPDALAALSRQTFAVKHADRMGLVLHGPEPVPGGGIVSEAVPVGAVQVTSGGAPIVLLADRGTLGGYTKPAVLHPAALAQAAQLREGDAVRFRPVERPSYRWDTEGPR